jgi:hypothetical protein
MRKRDVHGPFDVSEPGSGKSDQPEELRQGLMLVHQAKQSYSDALSKVQQMEKQPSVIERTGKVGSAFKNILAFGSMVAEVSSVARSISGIDGYSWILPMEPRWRSQLVPRHGRYVLLYA